MTTGAVYLDANAGLPARPEVIDAMARCLAAGGNASSVHAAGQAARARLEHARARIGSLAGVPADQVVFTSGGTEANNLILKGRPWRQVLLSAIEHPSLTQVLPGTQMIPVNQDGVVDLKALEAMLKTVEPGSVLVSVMLANNETGVIQPVAQVADLAHRAGALVHCDAAQAPGRLPTKLADLFVDFMTLSAHKAGGPPGIGVLIASKSGFELAPILLGGGQERHYRAGTHNLPGAVGMAVALSAAEAERGETVTRIGELRDYLERVAERLVPGCRIIGRNSDRLCNTSCLALPGVSAQTQVMALDVDGVMVSAGSACSSGKVGESKVLQAMGLDPSVAGSAIRVSLGPGNAGDDVKRFLAAWGRLARRKGFDVNDAALAA